MFSIDVIKLLKINIFTLVLNIYAPFIIENEGRGHKNQPGKVAHLQQG